MANATGRVVQILGGVVDVEFPKDEVPELFEAIEVERPGKQPLVLEVQKHIGDNWVRTVAMDATDGLQRGIPARATGNPILVPVGQATLGRIFNVQDTAIVEGSGSIVDRTREFLGPSDRAIIAARRQVLRAIREVEAGREAPHVIRTREKNRFPDLMVISEVITDGTDWRTQWRNKLAALR